MLPQERRPGPRPPKRAPMRRSSPSRRWEQAARAAMIKRYGVDRSTRQSLLALKPPLARREPPEAPPCTRDRPGGSSCR
eukprot:132959-Ditylum_brightwellii.AAC.1